MVKNISPVKQENVVLTTYACFSDAITLELNLSMCVWENYLCPLMYIDFAQISENLIFFIIASLALK